MEEKEINEKILEKSIEELELTVRTYNCLKSNNLRTIRDIVEFGENNLRKIRNFGRKTLEEISRKLKEFGVKLENKPDIPMEKTNQIDEDLYQALLKDGIACLKKLPNQKFLKSSEEYTILNNTVVLYLKNYAESKTNTAVEENDLNNIKNEVNSQIKEFKQIVTEKRKTSGAFLSEINDAIDGIRHYHHKPAKNHEYNHLHNPFSNDGRDGK